MLWVARYHQDGCLCHDLTLRKIEENAIRGYFTNYKRVRKECSGSETKLTVKSISRDQEQLPPTSVHVPHRQASSGIRRLTQRSELTAHQK